LTHRRSILVVDDDAAMRLAMARVLERAGFETTRCASAEEALEALRARPWDALVSDIRMPRMSGAELLEQGLALRPTLSVVLVTAYGTVSDAVEAIRRGARDYLLKPFAPEALVAAVARCLEGEPRGPSDAEGTVEPDVIAEDPAFRVFLEQADRAAGTDATVLITGQSGAGKEVIARRIHARSRRAAGPFVAVNCAALPETLLEAELFGVKRGAYTGAEEDRRGHFERAEGGTLLLDEIGDLPLALQAKLLRALEERRVMPLGGAEPVSVDIRVIAATQRDLVEAVSSGQFRRDLYFRLRVIPLQVPSLAERPADVPALAAHLSGRIAERLGRPAPKLSRDAMTRLERHAWPGNVRELRNVIERAVVLDRTGTIAAEDLFLDEWEAPAQESRLQPGMTIAQAERRLIEKTLDAAGGNRTKASEMLGISVRTLRNKLRTYREEKAAQQMSMV
jgi:two-component system response regulator FlrC